MTVEVPGGMGDSMLIACPKCHTQVEGTLPECPACGVIFSRLRGQPSAPPAAEPIPAPSVVQAAVEAPPQTSAPYAPTRRGITETSGRLVCGIAAALLIVQLAAFGLSVILSAFRGMYPLALATPAFGATMLLLVLGRILVELERLRAVAEKRAGPAWP